MLKYIVPLNYRTQPFVQKVCGGRIPNSIMFGGKNGDPVFVRIPSKKCLKIADRVVMSSDISGYIWHENRPIRFKFDLNLKIPAMLNFSRHRTNSKRKQAGSKSRRPIHGWSKRTRDYYLGKRVGS